MNEITKEDIDFLTKNAETMESILVKRDGSVEWRILYVDGTASSINRYEDGDFREGWLRQDFPHIIDNPLNINSADREALKLWCMREKG